MDRAAIGDLDQTSPLRIIERTLEHQLAADVVDLRPPP